MFVQSASNFVKIKIIGHIAEKIMIKVKKKFFTIDEILTENLMFNSEMWHLNEISSLIFLDFLFYHENSYWFPKNNMENGFGVYFHKNNRSMNW